MGIACTVSNALCASLKDIDGLLLFLLILTFFHFFLCGGPTTSTFLKWLTVMQLFFGKLQVLGYRQHHCRTCGNAVCAKCCSNTTKYPPMGFEISVRICNACQARMQQFPDQFEWVFSMQSRLLVANAVSNGMAPVIFWPSQNKSFRNL